MNEFEMYMNNTEKQDEESYELLNSNKDPNTLNKAFYRYITFLFHFSLLNKIFNIYLI